MNLYTGEAIALLLNGILIAVVITFPILIGFIVFLVFRSSMKKDRDQFEKQMISLLEEIRDTLVTIEKQSQVP